MNIMIMNDQVVRIETNSRCEETGRMMVNVRNVTAQNGGADFVRG